MKRALYAAAALAAALAGCSDEGPRVPAHIEMVLGDQHSGTVGRALDVPLLVRVTDRWGDGHGGAWVHFTVTEGGGALNGEWETCDGGLRWGGPTSRASAETSSDGYAWVQMTPTTFGTTTVEANVAGVSVSPVTFMVEAQEPQVTAEIAAPYEDEVVAGPRFEVGEQQLLIHVVDEHGSPLPGVSIRWEVTSGGGDLDLDAGSGCRTEERLPDLLMTRTGLDRENAPGYSAVQFRATAFGITMVTASVIGSSAAPATFTVDATSVLIALAQIGPDEWVFSGPEHKPEVNVPVGATVEWVVRGNGRIVSVSAPPGGTSFDSGDLAGGDRFQFVPDVPGTWTYVDQVRGIEGTLTAS